MWKFQEFSVIKILREINSGEYVISKNAFFCHSRALNLLIGNYQASKSAKIQKYQISEPPNVLKWQILQIYNPQN